MLDRSMLRCNFLGLLRLEPYGESDFNVVTRNIVYRSSFFV